MIKSNISLFFCEKIRQAINLTPTSIIGQLQEIRMRSDRPVILTVAGKSHILAQNGGFADCNALGINVDTKDIEYTLKTACEHSVYSYQRELSQCFVTVKGGHRVGIAGSAVYSDSGNITMPKSVSSLNFRIASQRIGSAEEIYKSIMGAKACGVLIVGKPMSAKTTILRDLSRLVGNDRRVALIDERSELAALYKGIPFCDVGIMTDVFDGYPKEIGVFHALRVMSPQVIICDEIGSQAEALALSEAAKCGVDIIASAHANSINQALKRKGISELVRQGAFTYAIMLGSDENIGKIMGVTMIGDEDYRSYDDIAFKHPLRIDKGFAAV